MLAVDIRRATFGAIDAWTAPDASCLAKVVLPSGGYLLAGEFVVAKVADDAGAVSWTYPPLAREHGPSTAVVLCTLGEQTAQAQARFEIP